MWSANSESDVCESRVLISVSGGELTKNTLLGGAGSAVLEVISSNEIKTKTMSIAIPDKFIQQDSPNKMREISGLTRDQILGAIRSKLTEVSNLC